MKTSVTSVVRISALCALVGTSVFVGCGDDKEGSVAGLRVETSIDTTELVAGTEIRVDCAAYRGGTRDESILSWELRVTPTPSTLVASDRFSAEKAGTYEIACAVANSIDVDDTPVTVTVVAAAASRAVASIEPETTTAGEPTTVSCSLQDGFGNEISKSGWTPNVTPKDSVEVSGVQLTSTLQGAFQVECVFDEYTVPTETATWTVVPGEPARLNISLEPAQDYYPIEQDITVLVEVYDAYDNRLDESAAVTDLAASPSAGWQIDVDASTVRFSEGGEYTLRASSESLSGEMLVQVDGEMPVIDITVPNRGDTRDGASELTISGVATDDRGIASVTVNGETASTEIATGKFTSTWALAYGVNLLHVVATDVAGNTAETWRSVTWSSDWYTLGEDPVNDVVNDGLMVVLTQALLDDGDHNPADPDDVATLVEVIMNGLDLESLIPDPLGSFLGCDYIMQEINLKPVTVSLQLKDGKIAIDVVVENFVLRVKNQGGILCFFHDGKEPGDWTNGSGPLQYLADALTVKAELSFENQDGVSVPKVDIVDVTSEGTFNLDIVIIDTIVDEFFNLVFDIFKGLIGDVLNMVFEDLIGQFALDIPLELPAIGGGEPNTLLLSAQPTNFTITPEAFTLGLSTQVVAQNQKRPRPVLGAAKYQGCGDEEPLPESDKLGWSMMIALHDEVLNQLMFGLWDGGTLNLKLGAEDIGDFDLAAFGISNLAVDLDGYVSPFFNGC
ncbi:MAG: hypothetical protein VX223_17270, partial [Myxococcota bacterium]|nr:hypothetical protein [Myxococcota bacterium]